MDAAHAAALDQRQHGMLMADAAALLDPLLLADESFVYFNNAAAVGSAIGGRNGPIRLASRMRWLMNHALLRLTPSVRCSWLELGRVDGYRKI